MADRSEVLTQAFAELRAGGMRSDEGLLEVINEQWLERTEGGDAGLIVNRLTREVNSGHPSDELCESLLSGQIVRIAREHIGGKREELTLYRIGQRAVRSYIGDMIAHSQAPRLTDATRAIDQAFSDEPEEPSTRSSLKETTGNAGLTGELPMRTIPAIRRAPRHYNRAENPIPQTYNEKVSYLRRANEVRSYRAQLKADISTGKLSMKDVLDDPMVVTLPVEKLLRKVPKIGPVKADRILATIRIAPKTEIGALTEREKARLLDLLPKPSAKTAKSSQFQANHGQFMDALKKANEARLYRASLKPLLTTGELTPADLLNDPVGSGMKLGEMLKCLPSYVRKVPHTRPANSVRLMEAILREADGLPGDKPCSELTERQRELLLRTLDRHRRGNVYVRIA